jgi:hypothetical protein
MRPDAKACKGAEYRLAEKHSHKTAENECCGTDIVYGFHCNFPYFFALPLHENSRAGCGFPGKSGHEKAQPSCDNGARGLSNAPEFRGNVIPEYSRACWTPCWLLVVSGHPLPLIAEEMPHGGGGKQGVSLHLQCLSIPRMQIAGF